MIKQKKYFCFLKRPYFLWNNTADCLFHAWLGQVFSYLSMYIPRSRWWLLVGKLTLGFTKWFPSRTTLASIATFCHFAPDFSDRVVERGQAPSHAGQRRQSRQILLLGNPLHPKTIRGTAEPYYSMKATTLSLFV